MKEPLYVLVVWSQVGAADNVQVAVALTLHTVVAEVGKKAEPVWSVHCPHIHRHVAHSSEKIAAPHLDLAQMLFGHYQQH